MQGILVGIASGFMVVFYRMILEKAEHIRQLITLNQPLWMIGGWFILLVLAALFVGRLMIKDPMICGSGIPQVEGVLANKLNMNPVSVLIRKFMYRSRVICWKGGAFYSTRSCNCTVDEPPI